ncbi:hypothetical protein CCR75_000851 [Bremia lactucae]|uniref:Uncharacterized protein n=1 Tax=Bremia lactucae TaxID=4779 RepID=A0A976FNH1_BRELC|nr:hypothetical protein CCR75_000851 [Bremia lactucae]
MTAVLQSLDNKVPAQVDGETALMMEEKCEEKSISSEPDPDAELLSTQVFMQENRDTTFNESLIKAHVKSYSTHNQSTSTQEHAPFQAHASPTFKSIPSPTKVVKPFKTTENTSDPLDEFRAKGPEGKFTRVFPSVSKLVESDGWQIAHGLNTLFCAMPGVQFFNFKPNINVFDSKRKACWKFIQLVGATTGDEHDDNGLWDLLWPIAENEFKWFTMTCGTETWYVKPQTKFEDFKPNETVFQSKKKAVLQCLAEEVGDIPLGESVEGFQVLSFAPLPKVESTFTKAKTSLFKTPSPAVKQIKGVQDTTAKSASFVTPAKHTQVASTTSSTKRKLASSGKRSSGSLKGKPSKVVLKHTNLRKQETNEPSVSENTTSLDEFHFLAPEFRCSFGIVYKKLQAEGWHCKSGTFEYDYFAPTYTKATKALNVNYFHSQADFEDFLKVSGTWKRIENELRNEHDVAVEQERELALERHHQRLEQQAARKRSVALYGLSSLPKPKKVKKASKKATRGDVARSPLITQAKVLKVPSMKFGTVLKKLLARGWYYRPGRFEYDYFKPSANPKTAISGEDRFESASALEIYLKTTGLWEQLADEVAQDEWDITETVEHAKQTKVTSPLMAAAVVSKKSPSHVVEKDVVKALTNDIWANSHEFDFNE